MLDVGLILNAAQIIAMLTAALWVIMSIRAKTAELALAIGTLSKAIDKLDRAVERLDDHARTLERRVTVLEVAGHTINQGGAP